MRGTEALLTGRNITRMLPGMIPRRESMAVIETGIHFYRDPVELNILEKGEMIIMRKIILASAIAAAALCGCSLEDAATSQETEATTVVEIDNIATESGVEKEASQSLETDGGK